MPVVAFTHFINVGPAQFGTFPDPGGTLSWTGGLDIPTAVEVDSGPDGLLEIGVDWFNATNIVFTGYVVEVEGETFAIFARPVERTGGAQYTIPYNPGGEDGIDLAPLANGGASTGYVANNALVFNCFATGTTILTPDGERAIETLSPGDRVVTHDGRSGRRGFAPVARTR